MKKIISLIVAFIGVFIIGVIIGRFMLAPHPPLADDNRPVYPTIYITGSGGKATTMDTMINDVTSDKDTRARKGLTIVVDTENNYSLKVTGTIDKHNSYPTIAVGMVKGTNNSLKYEGSLKAIMSYLGKHYNIPYANVLGYSAGGSGVYRYLTEYGYDRSLPPIKKWVSLDGQFNASTPQPDQTLAQVLTEGPKVKTKYYDYWLQNYERVDKSIQVVLLAGDYDSAKQTDGTVPWADSFSIYPLLMKNGNSVVHYLIKGNDTSHDDMPFNKQAINYIKVFFYE
ncbi:alpha/beta hydrolase [Lactococcus lactis]|jgi:uncharacterized alpha/beta hydrolase family protein|uniref:alpha/beta hydrolase n=1 Tax=Lactococcus lactis TaxID=1358 RepID=UPI0013C772D7|nr:alpha/beta hydrolase [Lactococcus lactis]MCT1173494.1 alpha/beta hydrolase [Lactococcus lactis]MCT1184960.1 alpha/beta hydrolase [Lactococcus lactis]MCT1190567.1 alpha/beta hydrolase [Lactococcus lactis]MDR2059401.1 alpha/beta hydrolase [Lactococcus lactis]NEX53299.1 alpha/beta hydrolase [Lactococcus lactis]